MISPQGRYGVYREALDTYGVYHQTMMAFEEMAELMKELKIGRASCRERVSSPV